MRAFVFYTTHTIEYLRNVLHAYTSLPTYTYTNQPYLPTVSFKFFPAKKKNLCMCVVCALYTREFVRRRRRRRRRVHEIVEFSLFELLGK